MDNLGVSERRACLILGQHRSAQRNERRQSDFSHAVTERTIELACDYGRYGYRRITELLCREGWAVNHKRVRRIWRREGLKIPLRLPNRRRLWLNGEIFGTLTEVQAHRDVEAGIQPHLAV